MFKHILLPTDGSELSQRALLAGVSFAKEVGAELTGITVLPAFRTFTFDAESIEMTETDYLANSERRGAGYLAVLADAARAVDVPCSTLLARSDRPYEEILRVARERACDLIIMASHGRHGVGAMLLGSETQKVLVHSAIPVLVYR
ncbi:universal stress protein [Massilia sp. Dwa41.01b]|uniref:universal stress protein n=1 Tax=unclassified Massilia TaxID=2609279 RepID=UPI0015FF2703|nr:MULTISPECIES: universal stress protein [unclassified Massilia]QNA89052.1 universal stress protein [Massilia sp. Dwa41.01b]QNA99940.1 universal stress protein [Massilia sp. Se16.2.3]